MARTIATYSIAACDLDAGQWGVATQSKFLAVGSVVPWAEPRVGAIATQAYANPRYGSEGLGLLREGLSAEEVVQRLTAADEGRDQRQLGIVDREGRSASFTGAECLDWAGGRTGPCYAAQGNILVSAATVDAIAETFESSTGTLAERLLDCLDAAQAAGGDRRGQQSAALLVVEQDAHVTKRAVPLCDQSLDGIQQSPAKAVGSHRSQRPVDHLDEHRQLVVDHVRQPIRAKQHLVAVLEQIIVDVRHAFSFPRTQRLHQYVA